MEHLDNTPQDALIPPRVGPWFDKLSKEQKESVNETDLRELADWYGGWNELRKVIDRLEDNDNEAAYERRYHRSIDAPSIQELQEKAYKQKYS